MDLFVFYFRFKRNKYIYITSRAPEPLNYNKTCYKSMPKFGKKGKNARTVSPHLHKNISWLFSSKNGVGEVGSSRVEIIVPRRCTATSPSHFWLVQEFRYISSATILVASLVSEVKTSTLSNWIAHELKKHQSTVSNGPSHLALVYIIGAKPGVVPSRGRFV